MSMRINIENILKSHKSVFEDILRKLQAQSLFNAQQSLEKHHHQFDQVLFDAINVTLQKLHKEENFISRLLYRSFGVGRSKNKRREQLIILGSELKSQFMKEKRYQHHLHQHQERLDSTLKNLRRLRKAFKDKVTFITSTLLQDRAYYYIQQIDEKITEVLAVQAQLSKHHTETKERLKIYEKQLKKIPRYHELREEEYIGIVGGKAECSA